MTLRWTISIAPVLAVVGLSLGVSPARTTHGEDKPPMEADASAKAGAEAPADSASDRPAGAKDAEAESREVDAAVLEAEDQRIAAVDKAVPSVLAIFAPGGQGGGSGVVISPDGYALSNFHVTKPCGNFMKCGMANGELYDAVIVGVDPVGDVALIKLFGRDDFPAAELADSDEVQVGDWCFAMGNPFLLATNYYPSVSYGVVSGVHRYQYPAGTLLEYADCLQVDAAINPGNSGGPLFDSQGRLIGINGRGSFEKRGRVNVGVGYSISINQIKNFLGHLKSGRIVDHATLGALVTTSENGRVTVSDILDNSDAYRRGLRYDDEIVSFAGRPVHSANTMKNLLGIFPKGWRVPITFRRDGKLHDTYVRLMGVHSEAELLEKLGENSRRAPQPRPGGPAPDKGKPRIEPGEKDSGGETPEQRLAKQVPQSVRKHFEARRGYANYHFNRENVDRVWKAIQSRGEFNTADKEWILVGTTMTGGQITMRLDDEDCSIELPTGDSSIAIERGLDAELNPPGSGGWLAAMHLWRKLLVGGPGKFGRLTYEGTGPLPGQMELYDILHGISGGVVVKFFCDPLDGAIVCLEMYPADGVDPCEVYFSDYREFQGRLIPYRLEVRHGNSVFGVFELTAYNF